MSAPTPAPIPALALNSYIEQVRSTVSYTHLDVYKRQGQVGQSGGALAGQSLVYELQNALSKIAQFTGCLLYTSRCV